MSSVIISILKQNRMIGYQKDRPIYQAIDSQVGSKTGAVLDVFGAKEAIDNQILDQINNGAQVIA
ncbi:hypothetical protein LU293_00030 [Moraxella nasovis]|uniref:hypothetical protein n=1 Tax=Moraxella nasovis TaxID=2904121 RepID=UPI001F614381|nr:hypothetical protein [Moraxella nasovis]UNU73341.1 hypothetical protein LU293_00030 [Moraxella nasovis]